VVEASSFRLGRTRGGSPPGSPPGSTSRPRPPRRARHLEDYEAAKARIWATSPPRHRGGQPRRPGGGPPPRRRPRPARVVVGPAAPAADYHVAGDDARRPRRASCSPSTSSARALPTTWPTPWPRGHRRGRRRRPRTACREALRRSGGSPTGSRPWARVGGVTYYDDSKATAPHATLAAVRGFDSVVLIAGGRNKGLDLVHAGRGRRPHPRRGGHRRGRRRGRRRLRRVRPVERADSMDDAVAGRRLARPGRRRAAVARPAPPSTGTLLRERGDDFARAVHAVGLPGGPDDHHPPRHAADHPPPRAPPVTTTARRRARPAPPPPAGGPSAGRHLRRLLWRGRHPQPARLW
jgi:hypothetical protein